MSIYSLITWMVVAGTAGFVFACLLVAPKVTELEAQLNTKKEQWCYNCKIHERLSYALNRLEDANAENLQLKQRFENRRAA